MQWVVIIVSALLHLCNARHFHQNSEDLNRNRGLHQQIKAVVVDHVTGIKYNPYTKHHPGRHVCTIQRNSTNPVKTKQTLCRPTYKKYYTKCGNGNQMCAGIKLVYETFHKEIVTAKSSNEIAYVCCPGWAQVTNRSHGCNKPICTPACGKGGECVNPGTCNCFPKYSGRYCETELKEMNYCWHECQNGGTCLPNGICSCHKGFQGKYCEKDIDECLEQKPCDQICYNTMGSYTCQCKETFVLQSDGQSCRKEYDEDTSFEARDLEFENLDKRLKKLEMGTIQNDITKAEINQIHGNIEHLSSNIKDLKNDIKYMEVYKKEMFFFKTKLNLIEKRANRIDEFLTTYEKTISN